MVWKTFDEPPPKRRHFMLRSSDIFGSFVKEARVHKGVIQILLGNDFYDEVSLANVDKSFFWASKTK
jgi:hypothetical protein